MEEEQKTGRLKADPRSEDESNISSAVSPGGNGLNMGVAVLIVVAGVVVIGGAVELILWKKGVLLKK